MLLIVFGGYSQTLNEHVGLNVALSRSNNWSNADQVSDNFREFNSWNNAPLGAGIERSYTPQYPRTWPTKSTLGLDCNTSESDLFVYTFDNYFEMYNNLSSNGNTIFPVFTNMHQYVTGDLGTLKIKPVVNNESPLLEDSYRFFSEYLSYYSIFFGKNEFKGNNNLPVDLKNIYVQQYMQDLPLVNQPQISGRNQASYLEILNEPDAWWLGPNGYYSPQEAAVCTNAAFDGDGGQIKTIIYDDYDLEVDPNGNVICKLDANGNKIPKILDADFECGFNQYSDFNLITPGIHEMNVEYVDQYLTALNNLRDPAAPPINFSVINFHHYSSYKLNQLLGLNAITPDDIVTASLAPRAPYSEGGVNNILNVEMDAQIQGDSERKMWIHPELDGYKLRGERLHEELQLRGINGEIWVTEWGYPSNTYPKQSMYWGGISSDNAQARWMMRGFMEYQASNHIKKSFWHWYQDLQASGNGNHDWDENCGIVNNDESKKTSWYHLNTMKQLIGDKNFDKQCYIDGDQASEEHFAWSYNISNGSVEPIIPNADNGTAEEDIISHPRVYRYSGTLPYSDEVFAAWIPTGGEFEHNKRMYLKDLFDQYDESFQYNPTQYYTTSPLEISGGYQNPYEISPFEDILVDDNGDSYITPLISDKPTFIRFKYCNPGNPYDITYENTSGNPVQEVFWNTTTPPPSDYLGVVTVKEGVHLIISHFVDAYFANSGKLVIEPGAKVTLNGKLTSCTYWQGVRVKGNPGGQQYEDATGFYPNQGFLKSQSGTIENARIGVQLISDFPHFSSTKNGGVVQCYNTKFLNNKTGVDLSLYEYRNNDSYFDNCDFIMNNNTNEYLQSHANLSFFYGINFTNCKFKNLKSTPSVSNFGINSIRSMFTVSGANSEFIGLATGIKTSFYQGSVPFTVENATFEKCAIGIANNGIFGSNIQNNTFKFGEMPSSYFGTIINGQKTQIGVHEQSLMAGLGLSGNVFFNTKLNSDYDMTGIYINDIGDFSNQIKGNDFKDLTVGLSAVHWNATYQLGTDNTTPLNQGLMLLCNTNHPSNHNRIFDFYSASQDVPPIEALRNKHGIPLGQNNYMSVGNTFSFRNWPDAHDFSNLSANKIKYYKFTSDETPVNYGGLDLIDADSKLNCGGARVIFPKNPIAEFDQMQQLMDNSQQAYADAFAIDDLNAMEEAENSIVYLQEQLDFIAFDGYIQAMEAFDMDEARFWMQKFNNLAGDLLLVADYMHTEEYTEAQNLLDQIETTYNFTPEKLADFQNVKYIYEQLMLNPVDQLPQNVMDNLRTWADSKNGQACYLARTIFGLLGNPYPPVVLEYIYNQDDNQQPAQRKKADNGINTPPVQIAIFPNPTNSDFEIRISNKSWNGKSTILLFDITGSQVGKYIIDEQQNQIKIQTNLPSGIYFCQIKGDGQVQLNQKIIINK